MLYIVIYKDLGSLQKPLYTPRGVIYDVILDVKS